MRRYSLLSSLLAIMLLFLVACGNGSTGGAGQVTIEWWHISTTNPLLTIFQDLANQYMKDHPNVKINITVRANDPFKEALNAAMQADDPPDIFQSWGGGVLQQYAEAGLLKDISADLQKDGWGASFGKAGLDLYSYNGKNYGVPWDLGAVGFWYNKALFAQAGITQVPATWDDFLNVVKTLKQKGITPISLGEGSKWPGAFYWEYLAVRLGGKAAFDKAYSRSGGAFTDEPFVKAGEYLKQLVDLQPFQNGFLGAGYDEVERPVMGNGQAAMELQGQWAPANNAASAKDGKGPEFGFFPFPAVPGGAGAPTDVLGGGNGFGIGKNAPPEAIDFVKFLTSVQNESLYAQKGAALPPVKAAQSAVTDANLKVVAELVANAGYYQLYYDQFMTPEVGNAVNDNTAKIFAGTATPQEVAKAIDDVAKAASS